MKSNLNVFGVFLGVSEITHHWEVWFSWIQWKCELT